MVKKNENTVEGNPTPIPSKQKSISISEFFESNRQMLGFSSLSRNMLITIKEAVDNAIDAAEDANILPDIFIKVKAVAPKLYEIYIKDNGPGIKKESLASAFGKLLYGSKFHERKQKRGQQGLGISAVVLNSQIDTGKPTFVRVKLADEDLAHEQYISIDVVKNIPKITQYKRKKVDYESGVELIITLKGMYIAEGSRSIKKYLELVSLMNPFVQITFIDPSNITTIYERSSEVIKNAEVSKLYPSTIEKGIFLRIIKDYKDTLQEFIENEIEGINSHIIKDIFIKTGLPRNILCRGLLSCEVEQLHESLKSYDYPVPDKSISLVGEKELLNALKHETYDFSVSATSATKVFQNSIAKYEVALVYGGKLPKDGKIEIVRVVNKVPLLLQKGSCVLYTTVSSLNWKNYGLDQNKDEIPSGPVKLIIHLAGFKLPFVSEAKESVAEIPALSNLLKSTLKKVALKLSKKLKKQQFIESQKQKLKLMELYLGEFYKTLEPYEKLSNQSVILSKCMSATIWKYVDNQLYFSNYSDGANTVTIHYDNGDKEVLRLEMNTILDFNKPNVDKVTSDLLLYKVNEHINWETTEKINYRSVISELPFKPNPILEKLDILIRDVCGQIKSLDVPCIDIRMRTKQNLIFHEDGYWTLGNQYSTKTGKKVSGLFQIIRILKLIYVFIKQISTQKTSSLREIYYYSEHWGSVYKFDKQADSDRYIEAIEVITGLSREHLGVFPETRGQIAGPIILKEITKRGPRIIDCQLDLPVRGGGIPIPFDVNSIEIVETNSAFVLAIETAGTFNRILENGFDKEYNAIIVCLNGQPTRSVKELLKKLDDRGLKILSFLDADNWSYRIHGSCAYGSIKTAHLSERLSVPSLYHLGLTFDDIVEYNLPTDKLKKVDIEGFEQLLSDPRYNTESWHDVFTRQMNAKIKAEQQALAAIDLNFVTDEYLPKKLKELGLA
jgi:DNA topoisomerase-6 subunit B